MFLSGRRAGYLAPVSSARVSSSRKRPPIDQLDVVDVDAFLLDGGGARRHRAGRQAADVLVMAAARHVEQHRAAGRRRTPA